jgi:trigger factor
MKVTHKNVDDLTLTVSIDIEKNDYAEKSRKILSDYRRKADIKGFRKGMAPMSLIEKMHGRSAVLDSVNELISQGLNDYIKNNNLNIIGEPLPNVTEQKEIDWDRDESFEFLFDVALAPKVEIVPNKDIKIPYYEVKSDAKAKSEYKSNLLKQNGTLKPADAIEDDDFIIADLVQGETKIEGSYISLKNVEDAKMRKPFIGKVAGDTLSIDVNKTFVNETDRAALLKVKKEELGGIDPNYEVVIKEVKRFAEAEENQDLYDRLFGKDVVKSSEEFDAKIEERMEAEYKLESDYRFMIDARNIMVEQSAIRIPEEFLKRWLYSANEGKFSSEEIERDFPLFAQDFKWQLVRESVMKAQNMQVTRENLLDHARKVASYQFSMYGLNNVPQEQLDKYAESLLANEKEGRRIYEKVEDDMVIDFIKENVTLTNKKISFEELHKLTA